MASPSIVGLVATIVIAVVLRSNSRLQQTASAVFDAFNTPIWGREQDAADKLAGFLMLQFGQANARKLLNGAAYFFEASDRTWTGSDFSDTRGTEAFAECAHPVFRTHEETGRKAIYVNRLMTIRIEGLAAQESDAALAALFDHSERPEFVYRHKWRVGDLIVWDNRCSMHARDDFPSDQRRLMFRTTVKGSSAPY